MYNNKKVTGIIVAAGNSTRYGQNRNKNFDKINSKEVFLYSLHAFNENTYIDNIIIAAKLDEIESVKEKIAKEVLDKPIQVVLGGKERKDSVYNCINTTDSDIVIIQDGARPFIKQQYINDCVQAMDEFKGVTIGVKSKDTIKITDQNGVVKDTTVRANTWLVQTPQCFDRRVLISMHEKYKNDEVTDDCSLLEKDGYSIKMILGDYQNIKITTYEDLATISDYLSK